MARFKWPVPSDEYFRRHIAEGERATREYRVERYSFLWEEFGPPADMLLVGGIPSMFALEELKRSYAYGNFMATVLLAQSFIEQSLGGAFAMDGSKDASAKTFSGLIDFALDEGHLSKELAETLHELRKMRNPYTHHIEGSGKRTYMGRLAASGFATPEDIALEDAKFAIRAVVDYLRHGSPNWNPTKVLWNEENV